MAFSILDGTLTEINFRVCYVAKDRSEITQRNVNTRPEWSGAWETGQMPV
jgi:hypothetical protein